MDDIVARQESCDGSIPVTQTPGGTDDGDDIKKTSPRTPVNGEESYCSGV